MQHRERERERESNFGEPKDKAGHRNGTMSSFWISSVSACCILMALHASDDSEETLLAFHISIGPSSGVMVG